MHVNKVRTETLRVTTRLANLSLCTIYQRILYVLQQCYESYRTTPNYTVFAIKPNHPLDTRLPTGAKPRTSRER